MNMKTTLRTILATLLLSCAAAINAQQVNTLYFLESAPMRHTINPAFQPVSNFYLTLPVIGYTSLWLGTNNWTMSDFVFKGPDGNTITPVHPDAPENWLEKHPSTFALDLDLHTNLLGFGFRIKEKSYLHINISEHLMFGVNLASSLFQINDMSSGVVGPLGLGFNFIGYTDVAVGFSHKINDQWTVGGKFKFLVGQANAKLSINDLKLGTSLDSLHISGQGSLYAAAPLNWNTLPDNLNDLANYDLSQLFGNLNNGDIMTVVKDLIKPSGMGAAFDLGVTYKPIKQLQISASVTDLGFIRWTRNASIGLSMDTAFYGVDIDFGDYGNIHQFNGDSLLGNVTGSLLDYLNCINVSNINKNPYVQMLTANLNVGVDANFWENRVGVGLHSRTRFYNSYITEELTFGAAFRPVNWFNLAASYSFINGHWSNIGAALAFAPYDGLMLTLATDYIPISYAKASINNTSIGLPYKTAGINVMFGVAIVAGTNKKKQKDSDKDGIWDKLDVCPNTPLNTRVDDMGCPLDTDGDGVADYIDECPYTPSVAYGLIDSVGCPSDTDGDGVADYIDECPATPVEAYGYLSTTGCPLDTDGDGVADYLDQCPNTPAAAYGMIDSVGCPLDTDGDGVYDYLDLCPETPAEARGMVDQNGCPLDTDKDGVYDYCDQCPETPAAARNFVDSVGCFLDTDGDGIYDYEDQCPTIAGVKENLGCPEVKREIRNLLKKAMSGIQFENGKATIKSSSNQILNDIAKIFIDNPNYIIEVQGHTDNVGKYEYNLDLSERRAQAVRTYLVNKGVPAERLTAHGYGPDRPIEDNKTKAGRAKNRRVEFNITFEEVTYETVYDRVQNSNNK